MMKRVLCALLILASVVQPALSLPRIDYNQLLVEAIEDNNVARAEQLLNSGADMHATIGLLKSPVWGQSITKNSNIDTMKLFLSRGLDVNVKNELGHTPLMYGSDVGNLAMVKFLIQAGANVNAQSNDGSTALQIASISNNSNSIEVVKLLLAHGANINALTEEGLPALLWAASRGKQDIVIELLSFIPLNAEERQDLRKALLAIVYINEQGELPVEVIHNMSRQQLAPIVGPQLDRAKAMLEELFDRETAQSVALANGFDDLAKLLDWSNPALQRLLRKKIVEELLGDNVPERIRAILPYELMIGVQPEQAQAE